MKKVKVCLDWTPNTNHIGFYVAKELGFYRQHDLEVILSHPGDDNYHKTPGRKLHDGDVDLALAPTESLFSYATSTRTDSSFVAIAAVLQSDASGIVLGKHLNISSPKELDGHIYGSYAAKYEDYIVKALIQADGGKGELEIVNPPMLDMWSYLEKGIIDATWFFLPWEGLLRKKEAGELTSFVLADWNIPYSYSPLLLARKDWLQNGGEKSELVNNFINATAKGWEAVRENPSDSAQILLEHVVEGQYKERALLEESIYQLLPHVFDDNGKWGEISLDKIKVFRDWLVGLKDMPDELKVPLESLDLRNLLYASCDD